MIASAPTRMAPRAPRTSRSCYRLFVTGSSSRAERAEANVRTLAVQLLCDVEPDVVDVLVRPDLAREASVVATPLLLRIGPGPARRIVGDFSDPQQLAMALGAS